MGHDCYTSDTSATQTTELRHKLILTSARVKTYFRTPILTIWQMKDHKERRNSILRNTFWKCLVTKKNAFEKCTTKTELCNGKSYIKKLYTQIVAANFLARSDIVMHSNATFFFYVNHFM